MSEMTQTTVIQLFRKWRGGDEVAGQEMAQRFSDWYYAISTIRVPGQRGRPPMEAACQSFAQGIVTVTRPRALVDWAHDLLERELASEGFGLDAHPNTGSDNPNGMTRDRSPTQLIRNVRESVDPDFIRILALAYDRETDIQAVNIAADNIGGTPYAMLQARYALKRALRSTQDVPFAVVPDTADMDRAPVSLYEANRLNSGPDMANLEKWLLSDIDLCKDIAEFSAFVHALRGGALSEWAVPLQEPPSVSTPQPVAEPAPQPVAEPVAKPAPQPTPKKATPQPTEPEPPAPADDEMVDADPGEVPPEATPAAVPAPRGRAIRTLLLTGATVVGAVILLIMIAIFALRAG